MVGNKERQRESVNHRGKRKQGKIISAMKPPLGATQKRTILAENTVKIQQDWNANKSKESKKEKKETQKMNIKDLKRRSNKISLLSVKMK